MFLGRKRRGDGGPTRIHLLAAVDAGAVVTDLRVTLNSCWPSSSRKISSPCRGGTREDDSCRETMKNATVFGQVQAETETVYPEARRMQLEETETIFRANAQKWKAVACFALHNVMLLNRYHVLGWVQLSHQVGFAHTPYPYCNCEYFRITASHVQYKLWYSTHYKKTQQN